MGQKCASCGTAFTCSDFFAAVDVINGATEHRFGSGPIEDDASARRRAFAAARKAAKQAPQYYDPAFIERAIRTIQAHPVS